MLGQTIAHYKVTAKLGAGGMGEVYRATDSKLGRDVALKVLPPAFAQDAQRMTRFQREAQLLASLNHPNIATIHGLEESGATRALVMELVEGPTLAERIAASAIPLDEALPIAKQIVDALEYAHDRGIIHRDLKPANIKLTPDGKVKVLDFGLAKALADEATSADTNASPTLSMAATKAGVILGTAAYMSPEQAKGKTADRRSDIWAFGCVLYEMLTGKQTFVGDSATEVLAEVLRTEPAWPALPANTPSSIRRLLRRALNKDAHLRLHSIADARLELEETSSVETEAGRGPNTAAGSRRKLLPWAIAAASLILLAIVGLNATKPGSAQPVTRFSFGENVSLYFARSLAISPDGKQVAFIYETGGLAEVFVRSLDQFESTKLRGASLAREPFFSPDGKSLGFISSDLKIRKYSFVDGTASMICECGANSASWGEGDRLVVSQITRLTEVSATSGESRELARVDSTKGESGFYTPAVLPGARAVVFTRVSRTSARDTQSKFAIEGFLLADKQRKVLLENASSPIYSETGHLLFHRDGALLAVPFDAERLEVTGPPSRVLDRVAVAGDGSMKVALSRTGVLVYATPEASQVVWVDRAGKVAPLREAPGNYASPRLSPDGTRLAITESGSVWVLDLVRQAYSLLTSSSFDRAFPMWTRDGERIIYSDEDVFWKRADGSGEQEVFLKEPPGRKIPTSVSPDGKAVAFMLLGPGVTGGDIYTVPLQGERKATPFLQTAAYEGGGQFSPSGKLMAYVSDQTGRREVYVTPYPGPGSKWQVSTNGGTHPLWNPNGRELFYRNGDELMAVAISEPPNFAASKPQLLFEAPFAFGAGTTIPNFTVTRDGQRFVMVRVAPGKEARIHVVVNWFEELRRTMNPGKN